jgi:hypothetical protein
MRLIQNILNKVIKTFNWIIRNFHLKGIQLCYVVWIVFNILKHIWQYMLCAAVHMIVHLDHQCYMYMYVFCCMAAA